jgi:putative endonuclease
MDFSVYIIYSQKLDRFYIGTTDVVSERLIEHNQGKYAGSFTSNGIPWELFLVIDQLESAQAYKIEKHIKAMKSKKYIQHLKKYPEMIEKIKARFLYVPGSTPIAIGAGGGAVKQSP